ncbi:MAG: helix-turn-helix transcriptional regulator [Halieaceae bacterium]|nr:helix-turn-helix transcriptional regulator [Halieaceae bacterium]MCP5148936.1 helix-turn-helix transcriptional regulator [Pseudomonadales bacterium]MCP5165853.1 helix-turn-helix transcriptional regulator [Pseudomonadales bacterium]MCP5188725.1 helix-turn-helix transcriptional regulator [Pseudomonadales bacterium]MCP5195031.1 helix-turn-helix transcriptional regulator [Pseudomonadales bacterium]
MSKLITRASSINRALDQVGDKWCLLILQEVFWGINSFNEMLAATGVSKGVLADRLKWLQAVDCLHKKAEDGGKRMRYHLTRKSVELYDCALMAIAWERRFFNTRELDEVGLHHRNCGHAFQPQLRCRACGDEVRVWDVSYKPGPGATRDQRDKKVRRRSSLSVQEVPSGRSLYKNLINIVGDRWTANVIALAFHGLTRFDQFHQELPVATNILSDRLRFLVEEGIFQQIAYQRRPVRYEYRLTARGEALYPWFLTLLQWGDKWCSPDGSGRPMHLTHEPCGKRLVGQVQCSACGGVLRAHEVEFELGQARSA